MELRGIVEKRDIPCPYLKINKNCVKLYFDANISAFALPRDFY